MAPVVKIPSAKAGDTRDMGSVLGLGRSPGEGNGNPLQYSCLENPMDRGPWQATVYRVTKIWSQLNTYAILHIHLHIYIFICFINSLK